jgi:heptosyltransferase-2
MTVRACVVRAPNWVGDAVMSLGGLRELRRLIGGARLAVAARPWVAAIYEETGIVDEVIPLDRRSWRDALSHAAAIRSGGYDLAVLFQNAFEAAFVARFARVPRIAGFPTERRGVLLTDEVPLPANHRTEHQSRYYMHVVAGVEQALHGTDTVRLDRADCSLVARPETVEIGRRLLESHGVAATESFVCINPGATNSRAKQWIPDRFAGSAEAIARTTGARIVVIGSAGESGVANAVIAGLSNSASAVNQTGKT